MDERRHGGSLQKLLRAVSFGLFVAAVVRELRTPAEERTWHGRLGVVPYDLRPPTVTRIRATLWAPDDPRLLQPQVFGVGWTVNLGRVWRLISDMVGARGRAA